MTTKVKIACFVFACAVSFALLLVKTDREFIDLTPSAGSVDNSVVLESGHMYKQTFPATRTSISRIGLYLRPAVRNLPDSAVDIQLLVEGELQTSAPVSTSVIDAEGVSQVRFQDPIQVSLGSPVTIAISVPPELSGQTRVLLRQPDDTFNNANATFSVDDAVQKAPLAYQVYYLYRPPLAWQMAGLLLLAAAAAFVPQSARNSVGAITALGVSVALLYALPSILFGKFPLLLILLTAASFTGMALLLKRFRLGTPAILLGAAMFSCTTWWPLHLATAWSAAPMLLGQTPDIKDIFLDSRQIPSANGGNFEHYGSYVGFIGLALAMVGIVVTFFSLSKKWYAGLLFTLIAGLVLAHGIPDLIIVATFAIALLAAGSLSAIQNFLGKDRVVSSLMYMVVIIVLLDLFYVGARTLEYTLL